MIRVLKIMLSSLTVLVSIAANPASSQEDVEEPKLSEVCDSINEKMESKSKLTAEESKYFSACMKLASREAIKLKDSDAPYSVFLDGFSAYSNGDEDK